MSGTGQSVAAGASDASGASVAQWAWALCPGRNIVVPSHHGHVTVVGSPPRFDTTVPRPRQAWHGLGSGASASGSMESGSVLTGRGGYSAGGRAT